MEMRGRAQKAATLRAKRKEKDEEKEAKEEKVGTVKGEEGKEEKRADVKKAKAKKRRRESIGKSVRNQEYEPSMDIEPRSAYMEPLHADLRIGGVFERKRAAMRYPNEEDIEPTKSGKRIAMNAMRNSEEYKTTLTWIKIDRHITGLTGANVRTILDNASLYLGGVSKHPLHSQMLSSMNEYAEISKLMKVVSTDEEAVAFGTRALKFVRVLMEWNVEARENVYLHMLARHMWRWRRVGDLSSQGLEHVQAQMKATKKKVARDKRSALLGKRKDSEADGQLAAIHSKVSKCASNDKSVCKRGGTEKEKNELFIMRINRTPIVSQGVPKQTKNCCPCSSQSSSHPRQEARRSKSKRRKV